MGRTLSLWPGSGGTLVQQYPSGTGTGAASGVRERRALEETHIQSQGECLQEDPWGSPQTIQTWHGVLGHNRHAFLGPLFCFI